MEELFLSNAIPKRGCWSYLTEIRNIYHTSDVSFPVIAIKYDKHPLFGPACDENNPSTTRRKNCFFLGLKSVDHFFWHHMMKIHLPNMYMIFECHTVENKYVALFYNTPKLSTFRIISDSLKLFAPNSLGPFQLLHFLLFFWLWSRSISSHSLLYSNLVWNFLTFFVPRTVMVVKLNQNYLEPSKGAFWYLLRFQIHCQCIRRLD